MSRPLLPTWVAVGLIGILLAVVAVCVLSIAYEVARELRRRLGHWR